MSKVIRGERMLRFIQNTNKLGLNVLFPKREYKRKDIKEAFSINKRMSLSKSIVMVNVRKNSLFPLIYYCCDHV